MLAQRPPLGNVPSPTPLVHQAAGRPLCGHPRSPASMGQARIPTRPPRNLCTPHTASAPCRRLCSLPTPHTASLLRRQVTGGKSSGPALRSCRSGAPSQSPLRGRGPAPLYSIPSSQRKDLQDYSPHPTSPQQPQLLHNDSFCKPRVRGTKELVMHRVATSECSTCSPHHALRSPLFLRGPHCQGDGDPVYGNCRPGLAAALLWAPSQIPGLPGLCWLSRHLWACDVCLLLNLCLFPPQPTLRRLTRPQETHGATWAAQYGQNGHRSFSHSNESCPCPWRGELVSRCPP